jgi:hypothetical protein
MDSVSDRVVHELEPVSLSTYMDLCIYIYTYARIRQTLKLGDDGGKKKASKRVAAAAGIKKEAYGSAAVQGLSRVKNGGAILESQ